jgi:pantoate--beta-alanine ligase
MFKSGITDTKKIIPQMRSILSQAPSINIEYISIVDAETLQPIEHAAGKILAAVAVRIGPARLIDNILVDTSTQ